MPYPTEKEKIDYPSFGYAGAVWMTSIYKHGQYNSWPWLVGGLGATWFLVQGASKITVRRDLYLTFFNTTVAVGLCTGYTLLKTRKIKSLDGFIFVLSALNIGRWTPRFIKDMEKYRNRPVQETPEESK